MFKQASFNRSMVGANALAESALFASRQAWLAGLGAASISREWARHEAGNTFRALVRKGSAVEKNAIQVIGGRVESSVATAASLWRVARATRAGRRQPARRYRRFGTAQRRDSRVRRNRDTEAAQAREERRGQSARVPYRPQRQAHRQKSEVA
jgi:hypothetical protein